MMLGAPRGWVVVALFTVWAPGFAGAQDYSVLRINEVIADNSSTNPRDIGGSHVDMIELYNTGSESLTLGRSDKSLSLALSDTDVLPDDPPVWTFRNGVEIPAQGRVVVFCDGNQTDDLCESHAAFSIYSDGSEPITLWGPQTGVDGQGRPIRAIVDQVWLPPLRNNVSFGRFPDGAGPAPVPEDDVLEVFSFNPPGTATFGSCLTTTVNCGNGLKKRTCLGQANGPGGNLEPRVGILEFSTNTPEAAEPVLFTVKVEDDKQPTPPNIASVEIVYQVNGGAQQVTPMSYDVAQGIQQGVIRDANGAILRDNPFDIWTLWRGEIPGQPDGAVVEFFIRARDAQGAQDQTPATLCPEGVGPCDREFGGAGCTFDSADETCSNPPFFGARYVACRKPFRYKVAPSPRSAVASLVINEVVPSQDNVLKDITEKPCSDNDLCPATNIDCCKFREDFIELYNSSSSQAVSLSGLWLSDGPFNPQVWQFPAGASIGPQEYLVVWLDNDGGKCPDPLRPSDQQPCFWECPDPTNPAAREYHTNFALNADNDEIFLFDTEENDFAAIHGLRFRDVARNHSLSLIPNGSRSGCWLDTGTPTPLAANVGVCPGVQFRRGDSNGSCVVDIADAIFTLNFLFSGGAAPLCPDAADSNDDGKIDLSDAVSALGFLFLGSPPPPEPGPFTPGNDPSDDTLGACSPPAC